jgi:hypothetical protein
LAALVALWWAGKDDWNKAHQIVADGEALTAHGFTLTCAALRAISTMQARRRPATGNLATEWATIAATLLASKSA